MSKNFVRFKPNRDRDRDYKKSKKTHKHQHIDESEQDHYKMLKQGFSMNDIAEDT